jgi:acetyl esterase
MTELALDPILAARLPMLEGVPELGATPPTPEEMRRFLAFSAAVDGYVAPEVGIASTTAPGPHGDVPVRVYAPLDGQRAARGLVWVHGGAFMFGDLDMPEADVVARELVARIGITVVSVDYRLCQGGVHFPVPHDDVHAAYCWAAGTQGPMGAGSTWAVGGASAGGNLAAGVAQRLRDEGSPPEALVLAYPVAHAPVPRGSDEHQAAMAELPDALRFSPGSTEFVNRNYLGDNPVDVPYAFPGLASVEGLPRTLVMVCEYDDLRATGEQLVDQLVAEGVPTEVDFVNGMLHGHLNIPGHPAALRSLESMSRFLGEAGR